MIKYSSYLLFLLFLCASCFSQQVLKPSDIETAKLAQAKAQVETLNAQLESLKAQRQSVDIALQLTQEHQQQKYSMYLGQAETIKQAHANDWGSADKVTFDPLKGEAGTFILTPPNEVPGAFINKEDKNGKKDANAKKDEAKKEKVR